MIPWANMKDNPCDRSCPRRHVGCHGTCKEYAQYKQRAQEQKQASTLEKYLDNDLKSFKIECIYKTRQRSHKYFRRGGAKQL